MVFVIRSSLCRVKEKGKEGLITVTHHNTGGGSYFKEGGQEGHMRKGKQNCDPNFTPEYKPALIPGRLVLASPHH